MQFYFCKKIQCGSFSPHLSLFSHTAHFSPSCQDFSTTFFIFYRKRFQQALSDSRVLYFPTTDCIFFSFSFLCISENYSLLFHYLCYFGRKKTVRGTQTLKERQFNNCIGLSIFGSRVPYYNNQKSN